MPIIGIVGRPEIIDGKSIIYVDENLRRIVYNSNCIPMVILPNQDIFYKETKSSDIKKLTSEEKEILKSLIDKIDGLIMPGGSRQYEYDKFIYKYALTKNIPILGICMGMQLMCNVDNELICERDVPVKNSSIINHLDLSGNLVHDVLIRKDTKLFDILKEKNIMVNSFHNYHIEKVNQLRISAISSDNYIEAVELEGYDFVIGVQWHPEKLNDDMNSKKIIDRFISVAKEVSNARSIKENI